MNLLKPRLAIDDFISLMQQVSPTQLQLEHLQNWIEQLDLRDDWLDQYIHFSSTTYQRKLLYRTSRFDLLILCWQPQQTSTIHDHQTSLNVTRVYRGQLTSRCFNAENSGSPCSAAASSDRRPLSLCQETWLKPGELATVDRHQIHQLANTADENLVTIHVYARPLKAITVYCPRSGRAEIAPVPYTPE